MQLGRMFSVFNKYMIYESTRKQEMLNETFFKTIYGKIGINYGDLIGIAKKKKKKKKNYQQGQKKKKKKKRISNKYNKK